MSILDAIATQPIRPLRRVEYDRLVDAGAFDGERLELIEGRLVHMTPQGNDHARAIVRLTRLLVRALGDRYDVRVQTPLSVSDLSEPEPDFAVTPIGAGGHDHPQTALLVIEVSVSTLAYDRAAKLPLYAAAGVPEYWIVNVPGGCVEVHREPRGDHYAEAFERRPGEDLAPAELPELRLAVADVLAG